MLDAVLQHISNDPKKVPKKRQQKVRVQKQQQKVPEAASAPTVHVQPEGSMKIQENSHVCSVCQKEFGLRENLRRHMKYIHGVRGTDFQGN